MLASFTALSLTTYKKALRHMYCLHIIHARHSTKLGFILYHSPCSCYSSGVALMTEVFSLQDIIVPLNNVGRKSYIRLNARDGESISISNAAIGADTTESLKNAVSVSITTNV